MEYPMVALEVVQRGGGVGGSYQVAEGRGGGGYFQMPLHYPKYTAEDYKFMPDWKIDHLLSEYGLPVIGTADQKRNFAMGAFLWTDY
ncbi:hypothetical protein BUALT_Bualt06G0095000 [Buddleja alternifolia]|uniref:DUF7722 domain-containing protein n=1 Tax=Buddleja alternifolia TaxID=168488 RepID=A0AAV6XPS5_9LAMI|nr:hypothetical protein BUALT_Bualt06G0095000 [Buddleja alternifolia]